MSIATAIQNAQQKVAAAYTAVSSKGGTLPQTQNLSNLPTAINSISGGSFIGIPREVSNEGVYQMLSQDFSFSLPADVIDLGKEALDEAFFDNAHLRTVNLNTQRITGQQACYDAFKQSGIQVLNCSATEINGLSAFGQSCDNCAYLTTISFPNLYTVGTDATNCFYQTFRNCTSLVSVEFPELVSVFAQNGFQYVFYNCTNLESISFPKLKQIGTTVSYYSVFRSAFSGCSKLTTVNFSKLENIYSGSAFNYSFSSCTSLQTLSFPSLKASGLRNDTFDSMLSNVTNCTVHFPSNLQSVIGSWSSVTNGFGGTNTTVSFDLTATE